MPQPPITTPGGEPVWYPGQTPGVAAGPPAEPGLGAKVKFAVGAYAIADGLVGDANQAFGDPLGIGDTTPTGALLQDLGVQLKPTPGLHHIGDFLRAELGHTAAGIYYATPVGIVDMGSSVGITLLTPVGEAIGEKIGEWLFG